MPCIRSSHLWSSDRTDGQAGSPLVHREILSGSTVSYSRPTLLQSRSHVFSQRSAMQDILSSSDQEETEPRRGKENCPGLRASKARKEARTQKSPHFLLHPKRILNIVFLP